MYRYPHHICTVASVAGWIMNSLRQAQGLYPEYNNLSLSH